MNQRNPKLCKYVITNVRLFKFEWGCNNIRDLDDHDLCKEHREPCMNTTDLIKQLEDMLEEVYDDEDGTSDLYKLLDRCIVLLTALKAKVKYCEDNNVYASASHDKDKGICFDCGVVITHCRLSRQQYYIPSLCERCYNETT